MKPKVIKQEKNPFLKREEFLIELIQESAPTEEEAKKAVGKNEELTIIKKIHTNFGKQSFTIDAVVYDTKEDKNAIEVIPQKVRKKLEAEKKAAEEEAKKKAAEEAEAAKKAEEKTKAEAEKPAEEKEEANN